MVRVPPFLLLLLLTAAPGWAADRPLVGATLFPLYDMARALSEGTSIEVFLAVPPGAEPHTWDPRPSDVARLSRATLILHLGKELEPWLPRVLAAIPPGRAEVVDLSRDPLNRLPGDPHLWLNLANVQVMAYTTRGALERLAPDQKERIGRNWESYDAALRKLGARFEEGLRKVKHREMVVAGHAAFGYLASWYGLVQIPLMGVSPEAEPGPRTVAEVVHRMREQGIRAVFAEELLSPRLAKTLADETGAQVFVLNPGHNLTSAEWKAGITFIALMDRNLDQLRKGLSLD